jgi:hypothetical protein
MVFTKRLREGVWGAGSSRAVSESRSEGRYRLDEGEIVIDSVEPISLQDITYDLAIESGFEGRADLLKVAKYGSGDNVYLVRFPYILPTANSRARDRDQTLKQR